jgi:AraC-like DNA-binding protein
MATVYDVLKGIQQAAANAYDGAHDERIVTDGVPKKAGLKREEGDLNIDARVMDGFNVNFHGNHLVVKYHGEMRLKDTHDKKFEDDIAANLNDITKYLKKEYKRLTKNSLTLTKKGEPDILVQYISRVRTTVQASQVYKIGNIDGVEMVSQKSDKDRLDQAIRKWLDLGKTAPKPKNVTRKKE